MCNRERSPHKDVHLKTRIQISKGNQIALLRELVITIMFLKRLSFGSKKCIEELKLECASFLGQFRQFCLISDPLIISKFPNETQDHKGQENKIYTIVKGRETFYRRQTVPITSCSAVKYVLNKDILWKQRMHQRTETRVCKFSGPD